MDLQRKKPLKNTLINKQRGVRIRNAHFKKNAMTQETIKHELLTYEKELRETHREFQDTFGHLDEATKRAFTAWNAIDEIGRAHV